MSGEAAERSKQGWRIRCYEASLIKELMMWYAAEEKRVAGAAKLDEDDYFHRSSGRTRWKWSGRQTA